MRKNTIGSILRLGLAIASLGVALLPMAAAAEDSSSEVGVEITPFAGFRFGGMFEDINTGTNITLDESESYGLVLDFDIERDKQIEIYLSRQSTTLSADGAFTGNPLFDLAVEYYHIGGLYLFEVESERLRPFVSGTLGAARMDPQRDDLSTETFFSLAIGGGAKFFFTENLGLRFDGRGIYTALSSSSAIFCAGGCTIKVHTSGFIQGELGAGMILRF